MKSDDRGSVNSQTQIDLSLKAVQPWLLCEFQSKQNIKFLRMSQAHDEIQDKHEYFSSVEEDPDIDFN